MGRHAGRQAGVLTQPESETDSPEQSVLSGSTDPAWGTDSLSWGISRAGCGPVQLSQHVLSDELSGESRNIYLFDLPPVWEAALGDRDHSCSLFVTHFSPVFLSYLPIPITVAIGLACMSVDRDGHMQGLRLPWLAWDSTSLTADFNES